MKAETTPNSAIATGWQRTGAQTASGASTASGWHSGVETAPGQGIIASARAMQTASPERFPSTTAALDAYLRTPQGNASYLEYRESVISGDARLPKPNR